jgi:hypothetical protein
MNKVFGVAALAVSLYFASLSGGCNPFGGLDQPTKNIVQASANLQAGMDSLAKIDPAGLNKLMAENAQLRKVAEELKAGLYAVNNPGLVSVGKNSRVWFEITGYTGRMRISAWLDSPVNKFYYNLEILNNERQLPMTYTNGSDYFVQQGNAVWKYLGYSGSFNINGPQTCFGTWWYCQTYLQTLINGRATVDTSYKAATENAFAEFLKNPFVKPSGNAEKQPIDLRLATQGEHTLYVSLTPEELDSHGNWTFEYKAYVERSDAKTDSKEERFLAGRLDSQTCKCKVGEPLTMPIGDFKVALEQGTSQ